LPEKSLLTGASPASVIKHHGQNNDRSSVRVRGSALAGIRRS
jgi:hypothetical protein